MRYISKEELERALPADWDEKVTSAKNYVHAEAEAAADACTNSKDKPGAIAKARSIAINRKASSTWQTLSEKLAPLSFNKCWYCECTEDRSDYAVDHFRPKNEVTEDPSHPGYWWLAFEWRNYRYACTYCNSFRKKQTSTEGGKQCHFPLLENTPRVNCDSDDCEKSESPMLLDPLIRADTKLLTFQSNGIPKPSKNEGSVEYVRAERSIDIYHLDENKINKSRQRIAQKITKLVNIISLHEDEPLKDELLFMVRAEAPYSQAARIYLRQYRDRLWVRDLLEDL